MPELMLALDQAILSGDEAGVKQFEARLTEFLAWTDQFPWPAAVKEALKERKVKSGALATPLSEAKRNSLAAFASWFRNWLPGVLKECRAALEPKGVTQRK